MSTFFHGWKRKVGVVTLLVACAFAGAWVRGVTICDSVKVVPFTGVNVLWFESQRGHFAFFHSIRSAPEMASIRWRSLRPYEGVRSSQYRWHWRFVGCGFDCASYEDSE